MWQQAGAADHIWANAMNDDPFIYKITPRNIWAKAEQAGHYHGAPVDFADGFIHFSTAAQVAETAARHFADQDDLLLVAVEARALGPDLKWEPSRGGALFPHLYASLDMAHVAWAKPMPLLNGAHVLPFAT